jgi:hypothetical protein
MLAGTVIFQRSQSPVEIIRQIKSRRISAGLRAEILDVMKEYLLGVCQKRLRRRRQARSGRWWRYRRAHKLLG